MLDEYTAETLWAEIKEEVEIWSRTRTQNGNRPPIPANLETAISILKTDAEIRDKEFKRQDDEANRRVEAYKFSLQAAGGIAALVAYLFTEAKAEGIHNPGNIFIYLFVSGCMAFSLVFVGSRIAFERTIRLSLADKIILPIAFIVFLIFCVSNYSTPLWKYITSNPTAPISTEKTTPNPSAHGATPELSASSRSGAIIQSSPPLCNPTPLQQAPDPARSPIQINIINTQATGPTPASRPVVHHDIRTPRSGKKPVIAPTSMSTTANCLCCHRNP
ncbi:hypothetical protein JK217_11120 [Gluconobacter kondonii]|uniref:hypothetical protein n=1 Tax=Gluconobacter kondonii TaxID=941463 RepID=UPI001B8C3A08|nr:hypothetical protein [Gluconobacter kondonii]MBS1078290.1 hypothetical protein [Gluconobacter kondonii]